MGILAIGIIGGYISYRIRRFTCGNGNAKIY